MNGVCQSCGSDRVEFDGNALWCECGELVVDTMEGQTCQAMPLAEQVGYLGDRYPLADLASAERTRLKFGEFWPEYKRHHKPIRRCIWPEGCDNTATSYGYCTQHVWTARKRGLVPGHEVPEHAARRGHY